ncbi:MAG: tetratricopeptide repeat protein [Planctomycetaceae bacterium]|nr:tetratricopeptide repeat protein [Planctomycetaceae bacterium]
MSVVPLQPSSPSSRSNSPTPVPNRWIISAWFDQILILSTPLLAIPAVFALNSRLGVAAETISLVVTSFFALGHHLPGMIRAYGDRELFARFQWRFMLAPPLLFLTYIPLQQTHPDFISLVIVVWATWHGLMQLYGFVRIYDARVGSTSPVTAWWDWLVCLCGFVTAQMFCPPRVAKVLGHWYSLGGPVIPPLIVQACRWIFLAITIVVLAGFIVNYILELYRGIKPNSVKLLLLASGIGTWWFSVAYVQNVILGAALFDICHDVQYLAIVWLYNCGRVKSNPQIGRFMSYVFRRGMVLMYLGLIAVYGAIGLLPAFVQDGRLNAILLGFLGTSTLLHYYYDGFIWKVRERSTQAGLGLTPDQATVATRRMSVPGGMHVLKWSPLILSAGWLLATDLAHPSLAQARKEELSKKYIQSLTGSTIQPGTPEEVSWLYTQFERAQVTAMSVPDDTDSQLRAAILLANFGRNEEAVDLIEKILKQNPDFSDGYMTLGQIDLYQGRMEKAYDHFSAALAHSSSDQDQSAACMKLGEVDMNRRQFESAQAWFEKALKYNPDLMAAADALRKNQRDRNASQ